MNSKTQNSLGLKLNLLVLRCQVGDQQAFKELCVQFNPVTRRFLKSLVKSDAASDLNQEVWISVYQRIASLDDVSRFKYWLYQITRNKAMDYFRKSKKLDYFDELTHGTALQLFTTYEDDKNLFYHKQIHKARESLSPKLNEVVELYYFQGMDYEEIALIVGCSMGTVKSRIHNAKHKIKEWLNKNH
ncbi:sigma-70 family RNA polymerase sigma factor [Hyunsoonleella sp. SJ7]|uniref:Sigma-70 family RNA polymerase sigma factor n=1 Tax=Hyunsoonleella aquatilis TaxID=2762758 RepID=A0A923HEA7_9FLAO|nr:sigma-70 family RNA polymerase sigma factor [Hyunsoonleella aquatilis]MBC3758638.1 sigma-70 family RNA polymerase sigma factor [Hyunsoonleella aquatilis]